MVEEREELQDFEPASEDEISFGRMILGFLLTLLLIPFLFAGACYGLFVIGPAFSITVGFAAAILLTLWAIKTTNPGIRWGIIVIAVIAVVIALIIAAGSLGRW